MMFYNTLFSFVAAIALASGVTAAVMPRGGGGGGEGGPQGGQTCITGSLSCCTSVSPFSSLSENEFGGLLNILDPNVNADVPIGLNCALSGVAGCNNQASCCDGILNQDGLVNVGLNCVNL